MIAATYAIHLTLPKPPSYSHLTLKNRQYVGIEGVVQPATTRPRAADDGGASLPGAARHGETNS
jgi:hypothetical protein